MRAVITEKLLRSLLAKGGQQKPIRDQALIGFEARPRGRWVTFSAVRRLPGKRQPVRVSVGRFPEMTLTQARDRARLLLCDLSDGVDPRARKAEQLQQRAAENERRFDAVAEQFIRRMGAARTHRDIEQRIRRELISRWGGRSIETLTRADIATLVTSIADRGHPEAARQTLIYTKRLFAWALTRGLLEHAPTSFVRAKDLIGAKKPRQRLLTDSELCLIWRGAATSTYPDREYVQLLLLTGTRRSELGECAWAELDLDKALWTIPAERMKSAEAHAIPLSPRAVEILRSIPRIGPFVFTVRGSTPFRGYDVLKRKLDQRIAELNGGEGIPRWVLHDCRRVFRTGLSTLGVAPAVAELAIAHRQPHLSRTYDLYRHLKERRDAFSAWEHRLLSIVEPPPGNVVPLRAQG